MNWPALPYDQFRSTGYLLHMCTQMIGKLKLATPFEPHWANVALWVTSNGLTSGPIPHPAGSFSIDIDLLLDQITCQTSWGKMARFPLHTMSVATLAQTLFAALKSIDVSVSINLMPQEILNPIPFDKDTEERLFSSDLAKDWLVILTNTYTIMQQYHARFTGISPALGFMWGTFDLRDARYLNIKVPTTGMNAGYIRRNAMDVAQIESGWFSGNDQYPRGAFYSFTYPQPDGLEKAQIQPDKARWDKTLSEFILDYDDLRESKEPEKKLLAFFDTTYEAGANLAIWPKNLIGSGEPV